jgi:hypothetical protein
MLSKDKRRIEYSKSDLPYSFNWKIRRAFYGKICPICGSKMIRFEYVGNYKMPSIQHNLPISKGGKHELSNISVICKACNITLKDKETGKLNNDEVISIWHEISNQKR